MDQSFPVSLIAAITDGRVIPFVGAGVSLAVLDVERNSMFPDWKQLLERAVQRLRDERKLPQANLAKAHMDVDDYLSAAKTVREGLGTNWFRFLDEQFNKKAPSANSESLDLARAVWRFGSPLVITTNYDRVLRWLVHAPQKLNSGPSPTVPT